MSIITFPNDYTTRYQFDTGNPLVVQFVRSDLSVYNLTGVDKTAMTKRLYNTVSKVSVNGAGSWATVNDLLGIAQYNWNAADVANIGPILVQTTIPFASGPVTFKPIEVQFIARL